MRSHPLINVAAFIILLPIFAFTFTMPLIGLMDNIKGFLHHPRWFDPLFLIPSILLYVTAAVLILWKGRLSSGLLSLFVAFGLLIAHASLFEMPRRYLLSIGSYSRTLGVDVYCNGVYLGKTPLTISEDEFRRKVKPWRTPPRQDIILWSGHPRYRSYGTAFLYHVPHDPFDWNRKENRHIFSQDLRDEIKSARYWWHFEKDGCVGLARIGNFVRGAGGGRIITVYADPDILYPSLKPHLRLLLHSLRRSGYKPSEEWIAHFRRYMDLLFYDFYRETRRDPRLKDALYAVIKAEFGIEDEMSEGEVERAMDEITDRVERAGAFTIPSPESVAIDLLGDRISDVLERRFSDLIPFALKDGGFFTSRMGDEEIITFRSKGRAARFLPLEYAIRRIKPLGLLDRLIYESSYGSTPNPRLIALIGNYRCDETERIVRRYLRDLAGGTGPISRFQRFRAAWFVSMIDNPMLEEDLRFFLDHLHPNESFIEAHLRASTVDPDWLADWIYHSSITDQDKARYLPRINSKRSYTYLRDLIERNPSARETVVLTLAGRPNPALDQLLIDLHKRGYPLEGDLIRAMFLCDTPKVRAYLHELWGRDSFAKLLTIPILSETDTPEALSILKSWSGDPDERIRSAARRSLEELSKLDRQAADLISGRIKPRDLLPAYTPYRWNGRDYVP